MLEQIILAGILLNITGFAIGSFLFVYFYVTDKHNMRELVERSENKKESTNTIQTVMFMISFILPYYVFLKTILIFYIITSNKSIEEKENSLDKIKIFKRR